MKSWPTLPSCALACLLLPLSCVVSTHGGPGEPLVVPLPEAEAEAKAVTPVKVGPTEIGAKHILIAYKGAQGGASLIDRSREEAKSLADSILARILAGESLADLAKEFSDDPGSKGSGGDLGVFHRGDMVKPFADAAFNLQIGEVSAVVESPFGFHIIERTE